MRWAIKRVGVLFAVVCLQVINAGSESDIKNREPSCLALSEWFPQTPPPANTRPDPNSECEFYRWAWQTFLFVTQPERKLSTLPRFINFQTPSALLVPSADDSSAIRSFIPRNVEAILQAGSSGIVIDRNGRELYYATHLNPEFVGFVRQNALTEPGQLQASPADLRFPKGSLQLKSSWKVVGPGDDASRFFTIRTLTPVFHLSSHGEIVVDPSKLREETLAMVGLHVVGVVDGHPEFIWATFEHNDNAPDLPVGIGPQTSQVVDTTRSWSLYARGTRAVDCNKKPETSTLVELFGPRKQASPAPVPVFREFAFGGDNEPHVIRSLNDSVHRQLPSELAVWKNYSFMGAMWLNDPERDFRENEDFNGAAAVHPERKVLGGDVKLSNATMETFTQSIQNCFSCHNTMAKSVGKGFYVSGKRLNMSHALTSAYRYLLPTGEKTPSDSRLRISADIAASCDSQPRVSSENMRGKIARLRGEDQ